MNRVISLTTSFILILLSVLVVRPAAADSPAQAANFWTGDYFNNAYLSGTAVVSRQEQSVAFNWGSGSPAAGIPSDNFSARWGSNPYFTAGTYRFTITVDDAVALTIDFQNSVFNTIASPKPGQTLTADYVISEGVHHLQLDYQEFGGDAYVYLSWTQISGNPSQPVVPSAIVMTNELNVRSGPGTAYPVVGKVYQGQLLTMTARNHGATWIAVNGNGISGWVNVSYVQPNVAITSLPALDGGPTPVPGILTATVNTGALNIRSGPASYFAIVTTLQRGGSMNVIGRNADTSWVQVQLYNGLQGWVNIKYIIASGNLYTLPITSGGNPTPPPATRTYVVQPGDNLYRISLRFGVSMAAIAAANNIYNYSRIYVGQVLIIP